MIQKYLKNMNKSIVIDFPYHLFHEDSILSNNFSKKNYIQNWFDCSDIYQAKNDTNMARYYKKAIWSSNMLSGLMKLL